VIDTAAAVRILGALDADKAAEEEKNISRPSLAASRPGVVSVKGDDHSKWSKESRRKVTTNYMDQIGTSAALKDAQQKAEPARGRLGARSRSERSKSGSIPDEVETPGRGLLGRGNSGISVLSMSTIHSLDHGNTDGVQHSQSNIGVAPELGAIEETGVYSDQQEPASGTTSTLDLKAGMRWNRSPSKPGVFQSSSNRSIKSFSSMRGNMTRSNSQQSYTPGVSSESQDNDAASTKSAAFNRSIVHQERRQDASNRSLAQKQGASDRSLGRVLLEEERRIKEKAAGFMNAYETVSENTGRGENDEETGTSPGAMHSTERPSGGTNEHGEHVTTAVIGLALDPLQEQDEDAEDKDDKTPLFDSFCSWRTLRIVSCGICIFSVLACVVIVAVYYSTQNDSFVVSDEEFSRCLVAEATDKFSTRFNEVVTKIEVAYGRDRALQIETPDTPQRKAACWLADGDEVQVVVYDTLSKWEERYVLAVVYFSTSNTAIFDLRGWLSGDHCKWEGVTCSSDGAVVVLLLKEFLLSWTIPTDIEGLGQLTYLDLSDNQLSGSIPESLFTLTNLRVLSLASNLLSGRLSDRIGALANLRFLDLGNNNFSNELPSEMKNLLELIQFNCAFNGFVGTIPTFFGAMSNLQLFDLARNGFSGTIPTEIGAWLIIQDLQIASNDLTGSIPSALWQLSTMSRIDIGSNNFENYTIPTSIGTWTKCEEFDLQDSNLYGTMPTEFGKMTKLSLLRLGNNGDLEGTIPTEIGLLTNLENFRIEETAVNGTVPSELGNLEKATKMRFEYSDIVGPMPTEVCNLLEGALELLTGMCDACSCCGPCFPLG